MRGPLVPTPRIGEGTADGPVPPRGSGPGSRFLSKNVPVVRGGAFYSC
jgi:hypothetical protein